jgi:hypothetical protein
VIARTKINILFQYIRTLTVIGRKLIIIRSDRDVETIILADYHIAFRKKNNSNLTINEIYYYGINIKNQQIELWWEQLINI